MKGKNEVRSGALNVDAGYRFAYGIAAFVTGFEPTQVRARGATKRPRRPDLPAVAQKRRKSRSRATVLPGTREPFMRSTFRPHEE